MQHVRFHKSGIRDERPGSILHDVVARTSRHVSLTCDVARRSAGQVFTPPSVATFMADQISSIGPHFRFVDAGAGIGVLSAAVCERIAAFDEPREIHADLYETDHAVLPALTETMSICRRTLEERGHQLTFSVHNEDFVLGRSDDSLFEGRKMSVADAVIMNPPYLKLAKGSPQARMFPEVVHGQPNLYALFMAAAVELLKPGGELVAITPRSFCNGLYFREFRRWFLSRMAMRRVHLFESRRATFKESDVLQESVITISTCQARPHTSIIVSSCHGSEMTDSVSHSHPAADLIDDSSGDRVIRLPSSEDDIAVMRTVESWKATFAQRGLRISTGPVVSFRATSFLLPAADHPEAIPLLSIHNVRPFVTVWPVTKGKKPIAFRSCDSSASLVLPARNYVLLRRFSAKEETRRLTASAYLPSTEDRKRPIAIENHLNYVTHQTRELTAREAHGLTALFNSAFLDRYFRTFSGNTQVNATEVRSLPFPPLDSLARIGERTAGVLPTERAAIEAIVLYELQIDPSTMTIVSGQYS